MAGLKTKQTDQSVTQFLERIDDETRREDCFTVLRLMKKITAKQPRMWGTSIVGFGNYRYKYESGREGDWFLVGFAPRKQDLVLYFMSGLAWYDALVKKLGKVKTGKGCLYIKRIAEVDLTTLEELIDQSVRRLTAKKK